LDANVNSAQELLDNYIQRILAGLPDDLRDLADELSEVVRYPDVADWGIQSPSEDWHFLSDSGLPKSCPTMIDLGADVQDLGDCVRIGSNNYGDPVCIEKAGGAVVYFEHDAPDRRRHQINKSPLAFLASICAYDKRALSATREAIRAIDSGAVNEGQWWHNETS
jgi:hypothetical protein